MANRSREIRQVLDSIRSVVQELRLASKASERSCGATAAQLFVLQSLEDSAGLSVNGIAERTYTHQSSVSEVVGRLAAQGMVERRVSREDARRAQLFLTARGRTALRRSPRSLQERLIASLGRMEPEERRRLAELLGKMMEGAGLASRRPPMLFESETKGPRDASRRKQHDTLPA